MNELPWASEWLYGLLGPVATAAGLTHIANGVTVVRVREGSAPASWPQAAARIIFGNQSPGSDRYVLSGDRAGVDPLYLVRGVLQTNSWSELAPIADAIDAALDGASGVAGEGRVVRCKRESPFSLIENGDPRFRHLGGLYRIHLGA